MGGAMRARLSIVLILLALAAAAQGSDPARTTTMLGTNNYLTYYGFTSGTYTYKSELVTKIAFSSRKEFGTIEGNATLDTPEEFITAAYFSPVQIQITDASIAAAIEKELPHTDQKISGDKLAAMWLKKRAEHTENVDSYRKAVDLIKAKTGVTDEEITTYYNEAIAQDVADTAREEFKPVVGKLPVAFNDTMLAALIKPLVSYYQNPSQQNFENLAKYLAAMLRKGNIDMRYQVLCSSYYSLIKDFAGEDFFKKVNTAGLQFFDANNYTPEFSELNTIVVSP
jgi:hypothetical protein